MVSYLSDLMEDATDFSWQEAKAAHTVLLCEMEWGPSNGMTWIVLIKSVGPTPKNTFQTSPHGEGFRSLRQETMVLQKLSKWYMYFFA